MIAQLAAGLPGIEMIPADRLGVRAEAKEAFALRCWHMRRITTARIICLRQQVPGTRRFSESW